MSRAAMRSVTVAAKGKGASNLVRRAATIMTRYGPGPGRMASRLQALLEIVEPHRCGATLPVTAAAVERHPGLFEPFAALGIEFAVHGYRHVDHAGLDVVDQVEQLARARRILEASGVPATGFRAPYLRWNRGTIHALRENGFLYDSSQAISWPVDGSTASDAYRRALDFYGALSADDHPAVPQIDDDLVRIPCSIPDDEAAVDRLGITSADEIGTLWLDILRRTNERGELFTLAVHPERIAACGPAVAAVLDRAATLRPGVWVTRLAEIARWWLERAATVVEVSTDGPDKLRVDLRGPEGLTVLARDLEIEGAEPWGDSYVRIPPARFELQADRRPFIGLHPASPESLRAFLREQGYLVETTESPDTHSLFLRRDTFSAADRLPLLREIESRRVPLLRLGRWPLGARSALAVTGDVDALTIWDYALRFLGR